MRFIILCLSLLALFTTGCAQSVEDVVGKYAPSVFKLNEGEEATCTTFYVGDDLFITAFHCVNSTNPNEDFTIEEDETNVVATLVAFDGINDVAVLNAPMLTDATPMDIWQGSAPPIGRMILTMGYPGYLGENFSIEVGYVIVPSISLNNPVVKRQMISKNMSYFGESGGPILDVRTGRVVAMVAKLHESIEITSGPQGHLHNTISLSTPYSEIQKLIDEAEETMDALEFKQD